MTARDCVLCGEAIDARRLAAVPEARLCIWCQRGDEKAMAAAAEVDAVTVRRGTHIRKLDP